MSVKIESAGLFVEAAYGPDGLPGLEGVTGSGEAHDIAWKQALSDAAMQLNELPSKVVNSVAIVSSGAINNAQELGGALPLNMGGQDNPVSRDRLSMTVASMVAWNMSVGMSDDVMAESIDPGLENELLPEDGILLSSDEFEDGDLSQMDSGLDSVQLQASSDAPSEGPPGLSGMADNRKPTDASAMAESTVTPEVALGQKPDDSVMFQDGSKLNESLKGMQSDSTKTMVVGSQYPNDGRVDTAANKPSTPLMTGLVTTPGSDILATYQTEASGPSAPKGPVGQSGLGSDGLSKISTNTGPDPMDAVIRVRSSSVVDPKVIAGQQRLEAIRQVLGQLENQAQMNAVAAELRDTSRSALQSQGAISSGIDPKGSGQALNGNNASLSATGAASQTQLQQGSKGTFTDNAVEDTRTFGTISEDVESFESVKRPSLPTTKLGPVGPVGGASSAQSNGNVETSSTPTQLIAAIAGLENAEIASDELTLMEGMEFDAENIEANEVPELIVQDSSQLDVDIDDAAGTVRLEMTRDGDEVTIRMRTPQEVLDSFRDMEAEMGEALADQGLDLSEFTAEGQDADGEEDAGIGETNQEKESRRGESDAGLVGAQELEQTGSTSRLVNRIV
jgi:hypothetical protein